MADEEVGELVEALDRAVLGGGGGRGDAFVAVVVGAVDDLGGGVAEAYDVLGALGGGFAFVAVEGSRPVSQTPGWTDTAVTRGSEAKTVSASCDCAYAASRE